jgi:hypothetical protein
MAAKSEKQRFRDTYAGLPDDQLKMVALRSDLQPDAEAALKEELEARNLTAADLKTFRREMKRNRAAARHAESTVHERARHFELRMALGFLVLMAWVCAWFMPFTVVSGQSRDLFELCAITAAFIGVSGFLGLRARRKGRKLGFYLMAVVPLVILVVSTIAALLTTFAP